MKPSYKHIFFDLDHTLWDFEKNSSETLVEIYFQFGMDELGKFSREEFILKFHSVNKFLWSLYHQGIIDRERLRSKRFGMVFEKLSVPHLFPAEEIAEEYLMKCPKKAHLFPYALDVLRYLRQHYILHIITNGFEEVQFIKLSTSKIQHYFSEIVTSDVSGFNKPHKGIFDFALHRINAFCSDCIMIGDDLEADILGAKNASIDHIYFNPTKIPHKEAVTHEINCLSELMTIL